MSREDRRTPNSSLDTGTRKGARRLDESAMSIRYEPIIYWSEDDQSFVVEVPELPGCMADGQAYEEAVANARQVIEEWLDAARDLGRQIPQPKGRLM